MNPQSAALTGLLAGLFGSTHCLVMCGGIIGLLHSQVPAGRSWLTLGFHGGRIASYVLIALLAAIAGRLPAGVLPEQAPVLMRWLLGALIVVMAVCIALPGRFRDLFGALAAPLTARLVPHLGRFLPVRSLDQAIGLGLLWGLLPCGLLYSLIAAALLLADPIASTAMVANFGLATVPLLLGGTLVTLRVRSAVHNSGLRALAATLLGASGVLIAFGPWLVGQIDHPWIHFLVDCVA